MTKIGKTLGAIASIPTKQAARQGFERRQSRGKKSLETGMVKCSLWLEDVAHARLKEFAFENNTSIQQVLEEGLDAVFAKYGQPSLGELHVIWQRRMAERLRETGN